VWQWRSPGRARCGDQRPTHAAASRSWRDSVGPLMPCGRRRPGPRRRGVGEEQFCAVQEGRGRQCVGSSQGRRRGGPGRGIDAAPHPVCAGELEREMRSASSGVQTRPPPWAPPAPGEDTRTGNGQDPPGGRPLRVRPIVRRTEPDEQITRAPLARLDLSGPRRSSCSRNITFPVASALLGLGPNGIYLRITDYTADHDRPTTRDRRRLRVTRQGRARGAAAVQVAVPGGSISDSEPSGPRDAP
jgi:hypothetical protein